MREQINDSPDEPRVGDGAFYLCMSIALMAASALQITALVGTLRMSGTPAAPPEACAQSIPVGSTQSGTAAMQAAANDANTPDACAVRAIAD